MDIDSRTGLVLEGGGMRAIFTVGVLDCFMDHDIWFPYTIGVSAGASNGISYASRQRGRSRFSNIDLLEKYDYIGFRHFLRGRGYIDMKYLFYIYPEKYYPLDYETYFKSPNRFVMVTSNCLTGKAEYFEEKQDAWSISVVPPVRFRCFVRWRMSTVSRWSTAVSAMPSRSGTPSTTVSART